LTRISFTFRSHDESKSSTVCSTNEFALGSNSAISGILVNRCDLPQRAQHGVGDEAGEAGRLRSQVFLSEGYSKLFERIGAILIWGLKIGI